MDASAGVPISIAQPRLSDGADLRVRLSDLLEPEGAANMCGRNGRGRKTSRRALSRSRASQRDRHRSVRPLKARVPVAFSSPNALATFERIFHRSSGNDRGPGARQGSMKNLSRDVRADAPIAAAQPRLSGGAAPGRPSDLSEPEGAANVCGRNGRGRKTSRRALSRSRARLWDRHGSVRPLKARVPVAFSSPNALATFERIFHRYSGRQVLSAENKSTVFSPRYNVHAIRQAVACSCRSDQTNDTCSLQ